MGIRQGVQGLVLAALVAACNGGSPAPTPVPTPTPTPAPTPTPTPTPSQPPAHEVARVIGPDGGEVVSLDGRLRLVFPAGALGSDETITIDRLEGSEIGPEFDGLAVGRVYLLGPDGLSFQQAVAVQYLTDQTPNQADGGLMASVQVLLVSDDGQLAVVDNPGLEADGDANSLHLLGELGHFSDVGEVLSDSFGNGSMGVAEPVPDTMRVGESQDVRFAAVGVEDTFTFESGEARDRGSIAYQPALLSVPLSRNQDGVFEGTINYACPAGSEPSPGVFAAEIRLMSNEWTFGGFPTLFFRFGKGVACEAQPTPPPAPALTPGLFPTPLEQPALIAAPLDLGTLFGPSAGPSSSQVQKNTGAENTAGLTFSGERDADDASAIDGVFAVFDPFARRVLLERDVPFFVFGTVAASSTDAAALFAWGDNGFALFSSDPSTADGFAVAASATSAAEINGAVQVGGGADTGEIVFASEDLGVGFVNFDAASGAFAVSDQGIAADRFFGDLREAYVDLPGGPGVALAVSTNSRVYYFTRGGADPTVAFDGLGVVNDMRCLPPLCVVFPVGSTNMPVFQFDGQNPPVRLDDVVLDFTPTGAALRNTAAGNVAVLLVRATSSTARVVELELNPAGGLVESFEVPLPDGCTTPFGPAYVPDGDGAAIVVTCLASNNYFVERSRIAFD
jgi:hypothetical protein